MKKFRDGIVQMALWAFFLLCFPQSIFGQQYLTENKGQWNPEVLFKKQTNGAVVYLKNQSISILQYDSRAWSKVVDHPHHSEKRLFKSAEKPITVNYHHFELAFVGANENVTPQGEMVSNYYLNYFHGDDASHWASNVRDFGIVRYVNLYDNIDLIVHGKGAGLKYDFHVKSGGNLNDIQMKYNHVDSIQVFADSLKITTSLGQLVENIPVSFIIDGAKKNEVSIQYKIVNGLIQFEALNTSQIDNIIVDPEVVFATYAGNSVDNFGFTATYDSAGSLYSGGIATAPDYDFNRNGFYPTTLGAFSRTYGGGSSKDRFGGYMFPCDITLSKYSPDGSTLIYATYIGGAHNEYPHSIVVDKNSNLIVFGTTYSLNYPTTLSAFQKFNNGITDIIFTKFNAGGTALIGSTFLGGSDVDGQNEEPVLNFFYADNHRGEVIVDSNDIIYASTCTSSDDFPLKNAFQTKRNGRQDGLFLMMNADLSDMLWGTYLGGTDGDALYTVDLDSNGMVYASGGTKSDNLPKTTAQIGTTAKGGISDGFIAMLNPTNFSLTKIGYWGTSKYDQIFSLDIDFENKIYVVGQSMGQMPVSGNVYSDPGSGQFITKFDDALNKIEFSTVFGTGKPSPDITINAFLVDECRKIFVSGWGGETSTKTFSSTSNLPITPDAYQKTTDGSDFYLMVLSKNAKELLYGTYFGGSQTNDHVDGGTSRFDKKGVIYQSVCASCPETQWQHAISDFPTTPGAYAEKNVSPRCSNAAFKIAFGNLNRKPQLQDTLFTFNALDTLSFLYSIFDPDDDSLFVTITPDVPTAPFMVAYKPYSEALENWTQNIKVTAGCDEVGDTLEMLVYAIDQGCPGVLDSQATVRFVITPPPLLDPPETVCLNFIGDDAVKLNWDPIPYSKYFSHTTLYKVSPGGDTSVLGVYKTINGASYTDNDVSNPKRTNYEYFLVVSNLCDKDGAMSYIVSTTKEFEFPIEVTYVVTATVTDDNHVRVNWLHSNETDFGYYDIYRKKNNNKEVFEYYASTYELYDTFFIDKSVDVNNQSYCYAIVVNDNCGHRSKHSNIGCTIVLEGVSEPFEHRLWWNEYKEWPVGVNEYVLSRSVDTGSLRPIVATAYDDRYYQDTSFNYCWGGYWYRVTGLENGGGYDAESQSNKIYLIQPPLLHVPNAFTPNGDNLNELWGIVPVFVKEYEVQVYNRWGEKVYDSNNVKTDWDGFYQGKQASNNVYIYKIRYTGWDRSVHHRKGTVTVIK